MPRVKKTNTECGHLDRKHYSLNRCRDCYKRHNIINGRSFKEKQCNICSKPCFKQEICSRCDKSSVETRFRNREYKDLNKDLFNLKRQLKRLETGSQKQENIKYAAYKKQWHSDNKARITQDRKNKVIELRSLLMTFYGSKCFTCYESDPHFLELDHIDETGWIDRKRLNISQSRFFSEILNGSRPKSQYQLLCSNCNWKKYLSTLNRKTNPLKDSIFHHYGKTCKCCGIIDLDVLSIDHINGGGTKQARELKQKGTSLYLWLKKMGFPGGFQTLCRNCNRSKFLHKVCAHKLLPTIIKDNCTL